MRQRAGKASNKDLIFIQQAMSGEYSRFRMETLNINTEITVLSSRLEDGNSSGDQTHQQSKPPPKRVRRYSGAKTSLAPVKEPPTSREDKSATSLTTKRDAEMNKGNPALAEPLKSVGPNTTVVKNKSSNGINESPRADVNDKEYYKKVGEPLARLWENPNDMDALGRVRELNKIIVDENKNHQRENKQGCI